VSASDSTGRVSVLGIVGSSHVALARPFCAEARRPRTPRFRGQRPVEEKCW
jgi:hypothetical protein